jgi:hypothetical protein
MEYVLTLGELLFACVACSFIRSCIRSFVRSFLCSFVRLFLCWFVNVVVVGGGDIAVTTMEY